MAVAGGFVLNRRARQRGQAMLALLLLLGIALSVFVYNAVDPTHAAVRREVRTQATMREVRDALIGWSASRTPTLASPNIRPGELPCPDITNSGNDPGPTCSAGAIGRVPWKSLGIPEPKDSSGETLWYAVSGPFRHYGLGYTNPITSDTLGNLTVYNGSSAVTVTAQAIAVIFAPGAALGGQDRDSAASAFCSTTGTTIARNLCAANYLEATSGGNNAQSGGPFIKAQPSDTFNDKVMVITNTDLMPVVERRVAREMISILRSYKAATATSPTYPGGVYPWADRSDGDSNDWNHNRFPCGTTLPVNWNTTVPSSSPSTNTPFLPLWLTNGCTNPDTNPVTGWTSVIYYAVARNELEGGGATCSNCTDATLTVANPSSRTAELCLMGMPCTPSVVSNDTYDLLLITSGAATAYPRCGTPPCWPTADFSTINGYFEDAQNRDNNDDTFEVPTSTTYNRDHIYLTK